tara:strand:+ start:567 stop:1004 length:438 start_codon:yes stop_codon:yes gene_type:complete
MDEENMTDFSEEELAYQQKLREAEADAVSNILKDGLNTENVVEAAENAAGFAQAMRNKIIDPQSPKIACKSKCHWCCHQSVGVFAPEVFRLTKYIKTSFSSKEQQALIKKIEAIDKNTRGKSPSQRAKLNIPCMFLVYGPESVTL